MPTLTYVPDIAELVNEFRSRYLVDFGCGNGWQYTRERCHVAWGVQMPILYEPYGNFRQPPCGNFDGLISIGFLDRMRPEDSGKLLQAVPGFATQWAFIVVRDTARWQAILAPLFAGRARLVLKGSV